MPLMQWINGDVTTTAQGGQLATDATVTPASLAGFPSLPQFTILDRETGELMLVTGLNPGSPNTWTVTRGYGGSSPAAITAGDHLEYSVTREMLTGGLVSKLDEQVLAAPAASVTLTVPTSVPLLRGLLIRARIRTVTQWGYLMARWGNDATASSYNNAYQYSGGGTSGGTFNALSYARLGWAGGPSGGSFHEVRVDGLGEPVWTRFNASQFYNGNGGESYVMQTGGEHRVATVFSTVVITADSAGNGVWAGQNLQTGSVLSLYGVP